MDQGESGALPGCSARDGVAIELASKAWLADRVWLTLRTDGEAQDKVLSHYASQVIEIDVRATLVPKREVLFAGCGRRERSVRLGDGVTTEIASVVLID